MSATVTASELQAVIGKWRRLISELKEENALLDTARQAYMAREEELRQLTAEWEETKAETQDAVMKVTAEITASRNEVAALEAQTASLNTRVAQRQEKTAQYKAILATKRAEVEATQERLHAAEEGVRQRLATFVAARADLKGELEAKIATVAELAAKDKEDAAAKAKDLERRIKTLEAVAAGEKKQWEAEKDRRDKEEKVACLAALREEIAASHKSKAREIGFLRDSASLKANIDQAASEIEALLANLSVAAPPAN